MPSALIILPSQRTSGGSWNSKCLSKKPIRQHKHERIFVLSEMSYRRGTNEVGNKIVS
jgi:hypothetical protein